MQTFQNFHFILSPNGMNNDPSMQFEEESTSRLQVQPWNPTTPLKTSSYKISIHSPLNDPFQAYHSTPYHPKPRNFSSNSGSHEGTISTSYDVYGNELPSSNFREEFSELESIEEETITEGFKIDKENNDPALNIITPLKKRSEGIRTNSARGSFCINRSPLLDITPSVPKRKNEVHEFKIERVLLYSANRTDKPNQGNMNSPSITKLLR